MYRSYANTMPFYRRASASLTSESNFGIRGGPETNATAKDAAEGQP